MGEKASEEMLDDKQNNNLHKVLLVRQLTENAFIIRLERKNMEFTAGQHIHLALPGDPEYREYSIYSGEQDDFIEVLIREIPDGNMTPRFKNLQKGDELELYGPFGYFRIREKDIDKNFLFIATGTGIAPFHSYIKTYPDLKYRVVHGIRYLIEAYESFDYDANRYITCASNDAEGDYRGYVTDYFLEHINYDEDTMIFLCGNRLMIDDVIRLGQDKGFRTDQFRAEIYY